MSGEPLSLVIGAKALDGLQMRMSALAWNMANASSPHFQEIKVDFESALRRAASQGEDAVRNLQFTFSAGQALGAADDRRMDLLIADASQTAMRYSALADMLGRRISLAAAAIGGQG